MEMSHSRSGRTHRLKWNSRGIHSHLIEILLQSQPRAFSAPRTSSECLRDSSEQACPWDVPARPPACLGMSRARRARRRCFVAGRGSGGAAGNSAQREISSPIYCLTPLSDLHLSIHPALSLSGLSAGLNLCLEGADGRWSKSDTSDQHYVCENTRWILTLDIRF